MSKLLFLNNGVDMDWCNGDKKDELLIYYIIIEWYNGVNVVFIDYIICLMG